MDKNSFRSLFVKMESYHTASSVSDSCGFFLLYTSVEGTLLDIFTNSCNLALLNSGIIFLELLMTAEQVTKNGVR